MIPESVICIQGTMCNRQCDKIHPKDRSFTYNLTIEKQRLFQKCKNGSECNIQDWCVYLHPNEVLNIDCPHQQCDRTQCYYLHADQLQFDKLDLEYGSLDNEQKKDKMKYIKDRGNTLYQDKNYMEAIEQYTQAIILCPRESLIFSNRAQCYMKMGKWEYVHLDCLQALELDENNLQAQYMNSICKLEHLRLQCNPNYMDVIRECYNDMKKIEVLAQMYKNEEMKNLHEIKNKIFRFQIRYKKEVIENQKNQLHQKLIEVINRANKPELLDEIYPYFQEDLNEQQEYPEYLTCMLSLMPFQDPVILESGISFEQSFITHHFAVNGKKDPISRTQLIRGQIPNIQLRQAIADYEFQLETKRNTNKHELSEIQFN